MPAARTFNKVVVDSLTFSSSPNLDQRGTKVIACLADGPLIVKTPTVRIRSSLPLDAAALVDVELDDATFLDFLTDVETWAATHAPSVAPEWFPEDGVLRSFVGEEGLATFKVADGSCVSLFDTAREPTPTIDEGVSVRLAIQMDGIAFGRSRYGVMWHIVQVMQVKDKSPSPPPQPEIQRQPSPDICMLIDSEDDDEPAPTDAPDASPAPTEALDPDLDI